MWERLSHRVSPVIVLDQFGSEDLVMRFPCVVCHRIALPLDQVLQSAPSSVELMPHDCFHFEFIFPLDHFRGRSIVVCPMFFCLEIGGQQGCMEYVMDGPGRWELELISNRRYLLHNREGSMTFRGQLARLIRERQIFGLEPDFISHLELVFWCYLRHLV